MERQLAEAFNKLCYRPSSRADQEQPRRISIALNGLDGVVYDGTTTLPLMDTDDGRASRKSSTSNFNTTLPSIEPTPSRKNSVSPMASAGAGTAAPHHRKSSTRPPPDASRRASSTTASAPPTTMDTTQPHLKLTLSLADPPRRHGSIADESADELRMTQTQRHGSVVAASAGVEMGLGVPQRHGSVVAVNSTTTGPAVHRGSVVLSSSATHMHRGSVVLTSSAGPVPEGLATASLGDMLKAVQAGANQRKASIAPSPAQQEEVCARPNQRKASAVAINENNLKSRGSIVSTGQGHRVSRVGLGSAGLPRGLR